MSRRLNTLASVAGIAGDLSVLDGRHFNMDFDSIKEWAGDAGGTSGS